MAAGENRDVSPALLKFGLALALSLGGILYSIFRTKRIKPSQSPPPPPSSDCGNQVRAGGGRVVMKTEFQALRVPSFSSNSASVSSEKYEGSCLSKVSPDNSVAALSPRSIYSGDNDGYILPEFNELAKDFDLAATDAGFSPKKDAPTIRYNVEAPRAYKHADIEVYEQEIKNLKNTVKVLRERETTLEIQLLEYYGIKEQETAVMELQNRLKITNVEAKFLTLKIESLQADNRRLEAQVADYSKLVAELESSRAKIKLLKKKLKSETAQNREQILTLQQRVQQLQQQEHEAAASRQKKIELQLQRLKDLEKEAEELRKSNRNLQVENSSLANKLECTQMLAHSVLEFEEAEALKGESQRLKEQNEGLSKEVEQLQAGRCADVEELVYLRWVNACLRFELKNHQPGGSGKTIAHLNKSLSSEEKAKKLILDYANQEGLAEKGINVTDSDLDHRSSSFGASATDSCEFDDSSLESSSQNNNKTDAASKTKIFSKLRRLLKVKDSRRPSRHLSLEKSASVENLTAHSSYSQRSDSGLRRPSLGSSRSSLDLHSSYSQRCNSSGLRRPSLGSSRSSVDLQRLSGKEDAKELEGGVSTNGDVGPSRALKDIVLGRGSAGDSPQGDQLDQKSELAKYAEVSKVSSDKRSQFPLRSVSHHSC